MKKASMRELHHNTSAIIQEVSEGQVFVIEKRGNPVAELRPFRLVPPSGGLPNREEFLAKFPKINIDSGRILEEDRS
jgi:antitoxin (DNA-binding transcriptional repressor) of toxin-antitoxin stability system